MLQLFLGVPLEGAFQRTFAEVNSALLSVFVKEAYLQQISYLQRVFLGKPVGVINEVTQLELSEAHLRSLLKRLLPEYPVESIPLYIFPMQPEESIIISEEEAGLRLDKILASRFNDVRSRTYFQELIAEHCVLLNGSPVKKRVQPKMGDEVEIAFRASPELDLKPEAIPLEILYEDDAILAINKPAGMVVHPAVGNWTGTFVNALLYHCQNLPLVSDSIRPGIVHRLDKETTGLLLAAKTPLAQQKLIELFASRLVYKEYMAICVGNPGEGEIEAPIGRHPIHRKLMAVIEGGRYALTRYHTVAFDGQLSLVNIVLCTGRTHQIRVHMKHRGTPVLGDALYGSASVNKRYDKSRQMLHARRLRFAHPLTGAPIELEASIPAEMEALITKIQK